MYTHINIYVYTHTHKYTYTYINIYVYTYTHTLECYSAIKEWNNAICSNMDGPRDTKWSQTEKDKYHIISLMNGI